MSGPQLHLRRYSKEPTPRELQILELVAEGLTNQQIGERLYLAPSTVKTHLEHVREKLGTSNRTALVVSAVRSGLITL